MSSLKSPPAAKEMSAFPLLRWGDEPLYRVARKQNSTWWFSADGSGRFDLTSVTDQGTCYFGVDRHAPLLEVFREQPVDPADLEIRSLRVVQLLGSRMLADTASREARGFGITLEIATITPYDICHEWAMRFFELGFAGLHHHLRHDPASGSGVSLFGPVGGSSDEWPEGETLPITRDDAERAGLRVRDVPSVRNLHVLTDP